MNTKTTSAAIVTLLASTAIATAGGVERSPQTTAMLFEEGNYVELGYTFINPSVSGRQVLDLPASAGPPPFPGSAAGSNSGDVVPTSDYASFAFRGELTEELSFAIIHDEPIGAVVDYAGITPGTGYLYRFGTGSTADLSSNQLTVAARYEMPNGFSVYGGLRAVSFEGEVELFTGSGGGAVSYTLDADASTELGYMLGAAYERPDIALRVALTYFSETTHDVSATEVTALGTSENSFETSIPQQVLLEAQSGVAEGTLVFGSVRWTDWTEFEIAPEDYVDIVSDGRALVDYEKDVWTFTLGGARVLTEQWTALGSITYEAEQDVFSGNLGPVDGRTSIGLGARFTEGPWRVTGGVNYTWIGDAETQAPNLDGVPEGTTFARFRDNTAVSYGIRVGYSF